MSCHQQNHALAQRASCRMRTQRIGTSWRGTGWLSSAHWVASLYGFSGDFISQEKVPGHPWRQVVVVRTETLALFTTSRRCTNTGEGIALGVLSRKRVRAIRCGSGSKNARRCYKCKRPLRTLRSKRQTEKNDED